MKAADRSGASVKYVVAVTRQEAKELAEHIGCDSIQEAKEHLTDVRAPQTDPYWASRYRIYKVEVPER